MLAIKYALMLAGIGMIAVAAAIMSYDFFLLMQYRRMLAGGGPEKLPSPQPPRWQQAIRLGATALAILILSACIAVVPSGSAGVRVSQISGTRPGTLYPGSHFIVPLIEEVAIYDTRERVFSTGGADNTKKTGATEPHQEMLNIQAREGLPLGLSLSVRYRLEAARLDYIHSNLPDDIDHKIVAPVIASVFRDLAPNYTVRELFATKREEIRNLATNQIEAKLEKEGILVSEVMLRDVELPPEYMEGLQGLLLKEQEADRMGVETEIQQKQVKIAELQAEQEKARAVKQAEGEAAVRVLQAKAEADAMKYTLPLKQKQIEQSKLEAQARKEATIENADAAAQATVKSAEANAQAKVIDSKAEGERRNVLANAEANRIRVVAAADSERMRSEAVALRRNPLLINKIFAERLSDKIRIMMVPMDGKFFMGDMLKGTMPDGSGGISVPPADEQDDPPATESTR